MHSQDENPSPPVRTSKSLVVADRPASRRPAWCGLRARPGEVARARSFASSEVFGLPFDAYEIGLITSELVTNAVNAARALGAWPDRMSPISIRMIATDRYVHLAVTDPDHRPLAGADRGGRLAEYGRGLSIVDQLAAARWVTYDERSKTVHVLIAATGVILSPAELEKVGMPT
ncbi:ATP-binding protein [Actinoallomurus rhizosphaericola]|uniref:ATP-binding protein n=1 Tax=Actinoallomurus rhizosphaericola TaxID=2952536 RepID=UPI00208FFE10|nr:ATP-binding protein [Actinoallomurus rhizosphaericola]MCO5994477.1 ATP-binding protein [Actinoallomurus rhizosphaericola]